MAAPTIFSTLNPGLGPLVGRFPIPHSNAIVRPGSPLPLYSVTTTPSLVNPYIVQYSLFRLCTAYGEKREEDHDRRFPGGGVVKVNHLNLTVTDVLAARDFLQRYFGLRGMG